MLAVTIDASFAYVLSGIIVSVVFGLAAGNYACSLVHRLPHNKPLLDKTPYCGSCGALLQVKDLFPVFSALMLKHRCRYCSAPFPTSHTWTEALTALLFVLVFLRFDFSQEYLLLTILGTFLITLAAIEANERMIATTVLLCTAFTGIVFRTLTDHSIYNFFDGGLMSLIIGLVLSYKNIKRIGHIYSVPPLAQLLAVGGICAGMEKLPMFLVIFAALCALRFVWKNIPVTVPFGLAVMYILSS